MSTRIAFVHTSPAAIGPVQEFYAAAAPELDTTHLLEDGILRFLSANDYRRAEERLQALIDVGRDVYGAAAVLVTCSALPRETMGNLRIHSAIPVLKIDEPMAKAAVQAGRRLAILVTFAPTMEPTIRLLTDAALKAGREVELAGCPVNGAYDALLAGRTEEHDRLLLQAAVEASRSADALVLAQVSMARTQKAIEEQVAIPVFSSLATSLTAVRQSLSGLPAGAR